MVEEKAPPKRQTEKQGLHGWKAAAAVFGCGTLAAFGVFGGLVGVAGLFLNLTSSGIEADSDASGGNLGDQIGEPQASIEPGDLDLCSRNLSSSSSLSLTRIDDEGDYADTFDAEERRISDQCEWELVPDYSATQSWNLDYNYEAVISTPEGGREDVASAEFDERVEALGSGLVEIENQGEGRLADRSYFVYGQVSPGVAGYTFLAQTRSAIYEIRIEAPSEEGAGDLVPENAMYHEASKIVSVSEVEFEIWIPGTD